MGLGPSGSAADAAARSRWGGNNNQKTGKMFSGGTAGPHRTAGMTAGYRPTESSGRILYECLNEDSLQDKSSEPIIMPVGLGMSGMSCQNK